MIDIQHIKSDFPIFKDHPRLAYLDNAATTQTPTGVVDAIVAYYEKYNANIHRGVYSLSTIASYMYEKAHETVARFIGAENDEVVFTYGTTHGLNIVARGLGKQLKKGDNVVLTMMEHHSNIVPWQEAAKEYGFDVRYIALTDDYQLDMDSAKQLIDKNTKVVSFVHISNVLGTINPAKELIALAQKVGAATVIDAAQSVPHMKTDVKDLDCDFLIFSGHKMCGPTGVGVLYGKKEALLAIDPLMYGGGMISAVSTDKDAKWNDLPWRFEGGTPNIAGGIALAYACEYLEKIGLDVIKQHEEELTDYLITALEGIDGVRIIGPKENRVGVVSFEVTGVHPHDVATVLDKHDVAVRAGRHCALPLMEMMGLPSGTARASVYFYNDEKDVDKLVVGLRKVVDLFIE